MRAGTHAHRLTDAHSVVEQNRKKHNAQQTCTVVTRQRHVRHSKKIIVVCFWKDLSKCATNMQSKQANFKAGRERERDSWDFTVEACRSRLAVGSPLMKERLMKEGSESCSQKKPAASHAVREVERRRWPVIIEQRVWSKTRALSTQRSLSQLSA